MSEVDTNLEFRSKMIDILLQQKELNYLFLRKIESLERIKSKNSIPYMRI